jgi:hypothetical protein
LNNKKRFGFATAIVVFIIIYGSLYPFNFHPPVEGLKPAVRALVDSWADAPSRSDFIANILFYMPFSFCAIVRPEDRSRHRIEDSRGYPDRGIAQCIDGGAAIF